MSNLSFKSTSKPFDNPKNQGIQRWAPIDPINHEKLTLLDTQTLERFYANYPLNAKQKTYKDFLISTQQGLALQQGPPGSGKTATAVAAIFETVMYRKKVLAAASSNVAVKRLFNTLISLLQGAYTADDAFILHG